LASANTHQAKDLRPVHHKRSHFPASGKWSGCVTSVWQKAWWWLLIAIVLSAPVLMLTGVLY
jgi:hypothetical protein